MEPPATFSSNVFVSFAYEDLSKSRTIVRVDNRTQQERVAPTQAFSTDQYSFNFRAPEFISVYIHMTVFVRLK